MPAGFAQLGPDEYIFTDPVTGDQRVGKRDGAVDTGWGQMGPKTPMDMSLSSNEAANAAAASDPNSAQNVAARRAAGSNREAWGAPPPGMLTQPGGRGGMPDNAVAPRFGVSEAPKLFRDRNAKPEQPRVNTESAWGGRLPPGMAAAGQNRMDRGVGRGGSMEMQKPMPEPRIGRGDYGMANIPVKR